MTTHLLFVLLCQADHDRLDRFVARLSAYAEPGTEPRHYVAMMAVTLALQVMEQRREEFRDRVHPMQVNDILLARDRLSSL